MEEKKKRDNIRLEDGLGDARIADQHCSLPFSKPGEVRGVEVPNEQDVSACLLFRKEWHAVLEPEITEAVRHLNFGGMLQSTQRLGGFVVVDDVESLDQRSNVGVLLEG